MFPASEYRMLQKQIRELHRLSRKKTIEAEVINGALDAAAGLDHLLLRSLVPPSAPISAGKDDVLVDEDVELVSGANLQCRLNVEILVDRAFGDAAESLREISPRGV